LSKIGEKTGSTFVQNRKAVAASLVAEGASDPTFARSGRAGDDQMSMFPDPITGCQALKQCAIEAAWGAVVDIFDDGSLTKLGDMQAPGEAIRGARPPWRKDRWRAGVQRWDGSARVISFLY
jgi:hypothetical protein